MSGRRFLSPELIKRLNQLGGGMPRGDQYSDPEEAFPLGTYLQEICESLIDFKVSCRVATTAPIALSGLQVIDGVAVVAGDRVLVKNQGGVSPGTHPDNGIYDVSSGSWTRSPDADENGELTAGAITSIEEGTSNGGFLYMLTTPNPIDIGTTPQTWSVINGGIGLAITPPVNVDKSAAVTGTSSRAARADHKHDIDTAAPSQGIGGGNAEGTGTDLARADHDHAVRETGGPTDLTVGAIADGEFLVRNGSVIEGSGGSGGGDLQDAYEAGGTITTSGAFGDVLIDGTEDVQIDTFLNLSDGAGLILTTNDALTAGDIVQLETDGDVGQADANTGSLSDAWVVGVAREAALANATVRLYTVPGCIIPVNFVAAPAAASNGKPAYVSTTPGLCSTAIPGGPPANRVVFVVGIIQGADGVATTVDVLFQPQFISRGAAVGP